MTFNIDERGKVTGDLEMKQGSHGVSGPYRLGGSVDTATGRILELWAAKAWVMHLGGNFAGMTGKGSITLPAQSGCEGSWTAQRSGASAKPAPLPAPAPAPASASASAPALAPAPKSAPAAATAPACAGADDAGNRLRKVNQLLKEGLITEQDATAKREEILRCL
ncbi:MAG: hypothetical protein EXQ99_00505 [Alphaproteobacteria bacterium]|nr:hypothetical protein [Alphaproteobacteria bacterium]